jgi:hypothetical protein
MSRMTNLERLVHYQDELSAMIKAGDQETDLYKELEKRVKELESSMPKYRPHVYQNIRDGKNFGKKK